jgi:hypothetical protein
MAYVISVNNGTSRSSALDLIRVYRVYMKQIDKPAQPYVCGEPGQFVFGKGFQSRSRNPLRLDFAARTSKDKKRSNVSCTQLIT